MQNDFLFMDQGVRQLKTTSEQVEIIRNILGVSEGKAKIFLVDLISYFTRPPKINFIIYVLKQKKTINKPFPLAKEMARILQDETEVIEAKVFLNDQVRSDEEDTIILVKKKEEDNSFQKQNVVTVKFDQHREPVYSNELLTKIQYKNTNTSDTDRFCPHGIPLTKICAICNKEKYKFYFGSD